MQNTCIQFKKRLISWAPRLESYIHTHTHTCIHTYMHTYLHTYMHTYTHIHTHSPTHPLTTTSPSAVAVTPRLSFRAESACGGGEGEWVVMVMVCVYVCVSVFVCVCVCVCVCVWLHMCTFRARAVFRCAHTFNACMYRSMTASRTHVP